ncbi:uncharacterized protein B0H18DRAFT_326834 [Fomitopsis serialis]|uniref:uncharacterized protein n=1 Tax=Fomitopsis serialis TaxID=139415 RepID=UPI002008D92A|nr:uncharacterized protein B0H18DRAFT_326834 [Neoantrodia serialis]KAH9936574.1 hypothetical protein B0H18DRAFT_326834 [Neoantrodia serialis]
MAPRSCLVFTHCMSIHSRNIAQPIVGYDVSTDDEGRAAHHSPSQDIESTAAIYSRTAIEAHAVDQHLDMMRKMRGASNHANAGDATPPISAAPAANHNIAVQSWRHELNKRLYANGIKTRVRWQLESLHRTQGPWVAIAIINGVEFGRGMAKTRDGAKEASAHEAYHNLLSSVQERGNTCRWTQCQLPLASDACTAGPHQASG